MLILIKLVFVVFFGDNFIYQETKGDKYEVRYRKNEFAKQEFNTVFIGSSRTVFGISPSYFDSLTDKKTKSYNFGIIAGLPPRTFDWCEELIQTKPSLKYVFVELSGTGIVPLNKNDEWLSDSYNEMVLAFFRPTLPRKKVEKIHYDLNIPLKEFLGRNNIPLTKYFSLQEVRLSHSYNKQIEEKNPIMKIPVDEFYWKRILELIKSAESKNIRLYFFIPPRLKTEKELRMVYPIYQKLEEKYKLRAAHYDESLYQIDTSFDNSHLNYKGAKKFTELMAEAFNSDK